jgi:hypothetical protein
VGGGGGGLDRTKRPQQEEKGTLPIFPFIFHMPVLFSNIADPDAHGYGSHLFWTPDSHKSEKLNPRRLILYSRRLAFELCCKFASL